MPGYLMHIDCAPEIIRNSKVGLKGIIAPDLWKSHTPTQEEYSSFLLIALIFLAMRRF